MIKRTTIISVIFAFTLIFLSGSKAFEEEVYLRYKFNKGDTLTYKLTEISNDGPLGTEERVRIQEWNIKEVSDDVVTIDLILKYFKVKSNLMGDVDYDSENHK